MDPYSGSFAVDYPNRDLERPASFLRFFMVIPILIVVGGKIVVK